MPAHCKVETQQRGPVLKIKYTIVRNSNEDCTRKFPSKLTNVDDLAVFGANMNGTELSVRMKKSDNAKNLIISVNITTGETNKHFFCPDNWIEVLIANIRHTCILCKCFETFYIYNTEVTIIVHAMTPTASTLGNELYEDTKSMDFNLQATDGAVPVHKSILFVHSEMFRTMLKGKWKETDEDSVNMPGVTVQTLQHLKDYMYLGTIPEEGLEPLLLLARRCLIDKLEAGCIDKLITLVKPETFDALVELACQNNIPNLVKKLVMRIPDDVVNGISQLKIDEKKPNDTN